MSDFLESVSRYFPPGVIDGTGRRLRPGTIVEFPVNDHILKAEVISWRTEGLILKTLDTDSEASDEKWFVRHPSEVRRVDIEIETSSTTSEFYIEVDGPSTCIIQCVGTRDLIYVPSPITDEQQIPPLEDFNSLREWSTFALSALENLEEEDRNQLLRSSFRAPILERVLQEGILPRIVERLVLVSTDQEPQHPFDTIFCSRILSLWLEAHGHIIDIGEPDTSRRWIRSVSVLPIVSLPHVVDAVVHKLKSDIPELSQNAQRTVVVHGGGTPAMNTAVLITASRFTSSMIRHIQVPEAHRGTGQKQPLIEFDLEDMPELGKAIQRST